MESKHWRTPTCEELWKWAWEETTLLGKPNYFIDWFYNSLLSQAFYFFPPTKQ